MSDSVQLPPAIRAWLPQRTQHWSAPVELPPALPAGKVQRLANGGPFGHLFDGRVDVIDGRVALEVLENSRMAGEQYFRVWEDGTIEGLEPAPQIGYGYRDETDRVAAEAAQHAHNRRAYDHLRERGFKGSSSTT